MKNQAILFILSIHVAIIDCRHRLQRSSPVDRVLPAQACPFERTDSGNPLAAA